LTSAAGYGGPVKVGVVFPQTEIGSDPVVIRAFAAAVEELGYAHILAYDHVVGADPSGHPGWAGPYDVDSTFHEPFALFGYLAAITSLELATGVVIMPQRQTVLVAKQAAQVDILTDGRFRLGVGLGWNPVEYEALGQDFTNRGRRMSEQVALLRRLWTERSVTFRGRYETVTAAGIAPLPVQRPIPIWFGASSEAALRRAGRLADGWFPQHRPGPGLEEAMAVVRETAAEAGRDPDTLGMEGRIGLRRGVEAAVEQVDAWRASGATHVSFSTMGIGAVGIDGHVVALAEVAGAIGLPPRKVS
jgi:probable F420-dependent oxidoreductase